MQRYLGAAARSHCTSLYFLAFLSSAFLAHRLHYYFSRNKPAGSVQAVNGDVPICGVRDSENSNLRNYLETVLFRDTTRREIIALLACIVLGSAFVVVPYVHKHASTTSRCPCRIMTRPAILQKRKKIPFGLPASRLWPV